MNGQYKREAPWDRLDGYNLPIETTTALTGTASQVAGGDPMRVLLIFALSGSNIPDGGTSGVPIGFGGIGANGPTVTVSMSHLVTTATGLYVAAGFPLIIDWRKFGPAVAHEWYAVSQASGPASLTVIQITAREWAGARDFESLIQMADSGDFYNRFAPAK